MIIRVDIRRGNILISQKPDLNGEWLDKISAAIIKQQIEEEEIVGVSINGMFTPIRSITFQ